MTQDLGASQHTAAGYWPEPRERRTGLALCLSNGGSRASLLHLGALRRLKELGLLSSLDNITSISGGSPSRASRPVGARAMGTTPDPDRDGHAREGDADPGARVDCGAQHFTTS